MKKHILAVILLIAAVFITYKSLPNSYFEQDEWHTFARFLSVRDGGSRDLMEATLLSGPLTHFTPLSFLTKYALFNQFGLEPYGYFVASLVFHSLVVVGIYYYLYLLTQNRPAAFVGGTFFAVNSSHMQAVSWIGTFEGSEGAALFGVLSLIFCFLYDRDKKIKYLLVSALSLLTALLFKETAFSFFVFYILILFVRGFDQNKKKKLLMLSLTAVFYLVLKFSYLVFGFTPHAPSVTFSSTSFALPLVYNAAALPVKTFSVGLMPRQFLINFSTAWADRFLGIKSLDNMIWANTQFAVFDFIAILLGLLILLPAFLKSGRNGLIKLSLLMALSGAAPFLIFRQPLIFLDSRLYYVPVIGVTILIAAAVQALNRKYWITVPVAVILLVSHVNFAWREIDRLIAEGNSRKLILNEILKNYPKISGRTVFFIDSDTGYFGLKEKTVPFQSGFGQTLLVNYVFRGEINSKMFENDFLWEIYSQGYKETDGKGFGYFRDRQTLEKALKENRIPIEDVVSLFWKGESQELKKDEIR
ncbi:MAG: TPR domain protein [Candidatus Woesebacteria bacterium GW2011_GWB1_45_5]|uniref:TPR domain protein n=1 Tax=Candidatus Woesebacteria bacterium GW2011_GWB1_45_5 TaxID=1618581 RepID=A0A0G1MP86_9BACT|nr:MAG: TPR domain protein [Candidatus Woesebacteria bacterium GW2011_GWB1_45_5]